MQMPDQLHSDCSALISPAARPGGQRVMSVGVANAPFPTLARGDRRHRVWEWRPHTGEITQSLRLGTAGGPGSQHTRCGHTVRPSRHRREADKQSPQAAIPRNQQWHVNRIPWTLGSLPLPLSRTLYSLAGLLAEGLSPGASERTPPSREWYPLFNKLAFDSPFGLGVEFSLSSLPKDPLCSPAGLARPAPRHATWVSRPGLACLTRVSPGFPSPGPRSLLRTGSLRFSECFQAESQGSGAGVGVPGRK